MLVYHHLDSLKNCLHHVQVLQGHTDFVNAVTFDPSEGQRVASTGDDLTCRVWNVEAQEEEIVFRLTAPGMAVAWHADEPLKVKFDKLTTSFKRLADPFLYH